MLTLVSAFLLQTRLNFSYMYFTFSKFLVETFKKCLWGLTAEIHEYRFKPKETPYFVVSHLLVVLVIHNFEKEKAEK